MQNIFPAVPPLSAGDTHVWLAWTNRFHSSKTLDVCRKLLSDDEREKYGRFYFERDRHLYLVSHAMVRYVLAAYLRTESRLLEFKTNAYGRPEIVRRAGMPYLRFNLSHTQGLAALAVKLGFSCGIDVEAYRDVGDVLALVDSVFTAGERKAFGEVPESDRLWTFLRIWTLKEAYIKARGKGLSIPLNRFSFDIREEIGIRFPAGFDDDSLTWQFAQRFLNSSHVLALAARHGGERSLTVSYQEFAPNAAGVAWFDDRQLAVGTNLCR
jgi:4'-phosphopantetheinyl transferase